MSITLTASRLPKKDIGMTVAAGSSTQHQQPAHEQRKTSRPAELHNTQTTMAGFQ